MFFSCANEERIVTIKGRISDPNLIIDISDVEVKLFAQTSTDGTFSYIYKFMESSLSDENGSFKFEFIYDYNLAYKLDFVKENYFAYSIEFESLELCPDDYYYREIELFPFTTLRIHLVNSFSFDENDKIMYRIIDWDKSCDGCCPPGFHEYVGDDVDEIIECRLIGESEYIIEYIVIKNGNYNVSMRTIFCSAFETTELDISY